MTLRDLILRFERLDRYPRPAQKQLLNDLAFALYLRKSHVPPMIEALRHMIDCAPPGIKFNPYHDEFGRFTFAPGGGDKKPDDAQSAENTHPIVNQIGLFLQRVFGISPAYAQEAGDDDEDAEPELLAEARTNAFNSAIAKLREVDPDNRELSFVTSPDWIPSIADITRINQEIANVRNTQITNMLAPGGVPLGNPGTKPTIRELPGGQAAAEEMFNELIRGATLDTPATFPTYGVGYRLPDGGFIGYRSESESGSPAIDVNITPLESIVRKLHFVGGDEP